MLSFRQPERRRSLLRPHRPAERRTPLWQSLAIAYGIVLGLALLAELLTGDGVPENFDRVALLTFTFTLPITVLAHYSSGFIGRIAGRFPSRTPHWILQALGWLLSGMIGSLAAFGLLLVLDSTAFGLAPRITTVLIAINGLAAICIGACILLWQLVRSHLARRNAMLGQQELLTAEFQAARNVQQSLLPAADLPLGGFEISGTTEPAVEIGGDYFDYLTFADGSKGIIVADAAGKGIPAALLMAKFQGMAQALSIHARTIAEFFIGLNDTLTVRLDRRSFITVALLTIDYDDRCAFYRAGHNPLLIYRAADRTVEVSRPSGIALGLAHGPIDRFPIEPATFTMAPGDVALLYSDGLTEATNAAGEDFGEERTEEILRAVGSRGLTAAAARGAILECLAAFVGHAEQHDDITVVVIRKV